MKPTRWVGATMLLAAFTLRIGDAFLMRTFNAQPYRGKKLRFRATARFLGSGADNQARLWLRVDRAHNAGVGLFDNRADHPITATNWRPYEISGIVDADAEYLSIGFMLLGDGKAEIEDVTVEVLEEKGWTMVTADHLSENYVPSANPLDPKREHALVAQLKELAISITTVEAGHGFEDLAPLDKIVGEARIVSLGEASHGTHARQCARIVQQAAKMNEPAQNSYGVRDQSMAENIQWLAKERYPNQKIVLWAHNGHVGDGTIVGGDSMGHHLRQISHHSPFQPARCMVGGRSVGARTWRSVRSGRAPGDVLPPHSQ